MMDASREDVLADMDFPKEHRPRIASTNPLERLSKQIDAPRPQGLRRGGLSSYCSDCS